MVVLRYCYSHIWQSSGTVLSSHDHQSYTFGAHSLHLHEQNLCLQTFQGLRACLLRRSRNCHLSLPILSGHSYIPQPQHSRLSGNRSSLRNNLPFLLQKRIHLHQDLQRILPQPLKEQIHQHKNQKLGLLLSKRRRATALITRHLIITLLL